MVNSLFFNSEPRMDANKRQYQVNGRCSWFIVRCSSIRRVQTSCTPYTFVGRAGPKALLRCSLWHIKMKCHLRLLAYRLPSGKQSVHFNWLSNKSQENFCYKDRKTRSFLWPPRAQRTSRKITEKKGRDTKIRKKRRFLSADFGEFKIKVSHKKAQETQKIVSREGAKAQRF